MPNSGQTLGQTRDQLRNNIQQLKDSLAENHFDLDTPNEGKHKFVQMIEQSPNGPATAVNEGAIYTKQGTDSATQLFWRPENQLAAGIEVQMTVQKAGDGVTNIPTISGTNVITFLPGGLLMITGQVAIGTANTTFPFGGFPNNLFNLQFTFTGPVGSGNATISIVSSGKTGFTRNVNIGSGSTVTGFNYLAIGN